LIFQFPKVEKATNERLEIYLGERLGFSILGNRFPETATGIRLGAWLQIQVQVHIRGYTRICDENHKNPKL
jgi:hypothetical protein